MSLIMAQIRSIRRASSLLCCSILGHAGQIGSLLRHTGRTLASVYLSCQHSNNASGHLLKYACMGAQASCRH